MHMFDVDDQISYRGLCLLRNELQRRCEVYEPDTLAGDLYRKDLAEVKRLMRDWYLSNRWV